MPKLLSITDAVNASIGYTRPVRAGEEVLNAGFIISVGLKKKEGSILHVQALALRTSGITTQHPYTIEIWIDLEKELGSRVVKEKSVECECKAGESEKCKHIIAVMLKLARIEENELEDLTCTDIEQQWGQLKTATLAEYQAQPLADLCHVQAQKNVYVSSIPPVTREMEKKWEERLMRSNPSGEYPIFYSTMRRGQGLVENNQETRRAENKYNAAIMSKLLATSSSSEIDLLQNLTKIKVQSLRPDLRQFYENNVEISIEQSIAIACVHQGTDEWHHERKKRLTSSTARSQYTYYANPKANWDKRYENLYHSTFSGNEDTLRGLRCEGPARDAYEKDTGKSVYECGCLIRPEIPWLSASLDGVVVDEQGEILRSIEIKSGKEGARLTAAELLKERAVKTLDNTGQLNEANDHFGQVQIGMLLSGLIGSVTTLFTQKREMIFTKFA